MKKSQITAINRIIKNNNDRPALKGYFINDGKYIVTDGYTAARFDTIPEEINPAPPALVNMRPFFNLNNFNTCAPIDAPALSTLTEIIREKRAQKIPGYSVDSLPLYIFELNGARVAVNAKYLKNLLNIIPAAVIYFSYNRPEISALYIKSKTDNIDGLIMPVRVTK